MNKKYKLIIFDLIDTLASGENILELTKKLEQEIGLETVSFIIGGGKIDTEKSADDTIARVKSFKDITQKQEELIREWIEPGSLSLLPDSIEILKYLKDRSYILGIIS